MLVLDSGGLSRLAARDRATGTLVQQLHRRGLWPPVVPTPVLIESLTGTPPRDANTNRILKTCVVKDRLTESLARRAASLRTQARRGSAVDALVVAHAETGGTVLTSDGADLKALAANAADVLVEVV